MPVTPTWSSRLRGTNRRSWRSCWRGPNSPKRSCRRFIAASKVSVRAVSWTRKPSPGFIRGSSPKAMPAPTRTSCSTPSTPTATGLCASRTLPWGSRCCCGGRCGSGWSGRSTSTTSTRTAASPRRRCCGSSSPFTPCWGAAPGPPCGTACPPSTWRSSSRRWTGTGTAW